MNALGHLAIQPLHLRRRFERARRAFGFLPGGGLRFGGACASFPRGLLRAFVRGLLVRQTLGHSSFQFVQLGVTRAYVMQVLPLERAQLRAQVCGAQLAFGQLALDRRLLLAFAREFLLFGIQLRI